ncbi:MAG: filamentous hemagglutinin N-terminal domain-containing protein [Schwartzia sp.]|nr:filamentous hemagglutinin N-terminal domain-containing protein [Schwartzia sp. (in: firmicutes)]
MKHQTVHGRTHKNGMSRRLALAVGAALLSGAFSVMPVACANPVLDVKDAAVTITGTSDMSITSTAANNVIKWVDFSIGSGEKVAFDTNNYLNFVTGSARSDILGTLTGGGNIYLVNPNGILIGDNATVNVGNLYLSTKQLDVAALTSYDAGISQLSSVVAAAGDVINLGNLNATSITVEGNNITFKNVADVTLKNDAPEGSKINVTADGEIRVGFAVGDEATDFSDTQYTIDKSSGAIKDFNGNSVTLSNPAGWSFNGGEKTPVQYMLVRNRFELQNINNNRSGNYMLASDVTLPTVAEGESNFTPIGGYNKNWYREPFSGKFDGLGHQIENLAVHITESIYIEQDDGYAPLKEDVNDEVGLFSRVGETGVVENLGLVGGSVAGTDHVGGIAGANEGTIRNVYHTGSVTGRSYVGGVAGVNDGTVERAYNTGTVTGTLIDVGGVAGANGGTINEVLNTGTVSSSDNNVGGIAGRMMSSYVINAYNTGAVTGANMVGGIAGSMNNRGAEVTNVYNTGSVTGTGTSGRVGGLVGDLDQGTLTNAYTKSGVASATNITDYENYYVHDTVGNRPDYGVKIDNEADLMKAATFYQGDEEHPGFGFTQNDDGSYTGFSESGVWRIYEGYTMPLLTAFLTRKDDTTSRMTIYDGTADVGNATYETSQHKSAESQIGGFNYIKDVIKVTPKELTVSFADISKTYDGTTDATAGAGALTGVIDNDKDKVGVTASAEYADENAGENKQVKYTSVALTGDGAGNYTIATTATGSGTINRKEVTASFTDGIRKTYDGTTNDVDKLGYAVASRTGKLDGVVAGDAGKVSVSGKATYADKNASNSYDTPDKTVTYSGLALGAGTDGDASSNYVLASTTVTAENNGRIDKANVTLTVGKVTKTYDGTTTVTGGTLIAKPGGGTIFGSDSLSGGKFEYADKNAGTGKTVTVSSGSATITDVKTGADTSGNYNITYEDNTNGTITRKALSLVAAPVTITEGEAVPAFTGDVTGFVAGEGLETTDALTFGADANAKTAGVYAVTGTLNGATSGDYGQNYTFDNAASNATAFTIKTKIVTPEEFIANATGSQGTAAEYTNTIASLNSETTNGLSSPVTTTLNEATPGSQNDNTQEGNTGAAVPQTQNAGGLSFTTSERLTIQGGGVNMPESMGTEALAAALSGAAPAGGAPPSNATPTNEPTAQTPVPGTEPTAEPTSAQDDEEE